MAAATPRAQRGIQSIEVGAKLLVALVHQGRPLALKDLAQEAGMTAAKAHPYLVSFGRAGLIAQDDATGRYFLGPLALQLGLISLQQAGPVQTATPYAAALAQRLGYTVALAVWGTRGATIVRVEESPTAVHVNMRHGTVFSLAHTASGRLFGAYLDADAVRAALEAERRRERGRRATQDAAAGTVLPRPVPEWKAFEPQLAEVRQRGLSRSEGEVVAGVGAMAAPIFDHAGAIVLGITVIGPSASMSTAWDGAPAKALKACAAEVSARLGWRGGAGDAGRRIEAT
ncbi:MAG: IclR family transcriptional regulator [Proteobacteria bacterium]|nr:IclR family transcriptional regulator [Pseudomonadota bacterium]